jgi:hypothetical protein
MKKNILLLFACFISVASMAQQAESYPIWTISKDVQKIQFRNSQYTPSEVKTATQVPYAKGIAVLQNRQTSKISRSIRMDGMPSNVIQKGVARMQFERSGK